MINLKKSKIMQMTFQRPLKFEYRKQVHYSVIHFHGIGGKLELFYNPLNKNNIISHNGNGEDILKVMNYLGNSGWNLNNINNVKKTRITQYIFEKELYPRKDL